MLMTLGKVFLIKTSTKQYILLHVLLKLGNLKWPIGKQDCHIIIYIGCHLCVGLTRINDNAEDLSQYDPCS